MNTAMPEALFSAAIVFTIFYYQAPIRWSPLYRQSKIWTFTAAFLLPKNSKIWFCI